MKPFMLNLKQIALALLVIFSVSCSPEDGEDGAQGPAGEDGNANVIVKTIEADPGRPYLDWTAGSYLGAQANIYEINDTDITQDVLDNSLILVHFQLFEEATWYPMTFNWLESDGGDQLITFDYTLNLLTIYSAQTSGTLGASVSKVKYFIIDSSNSSTNRTQSIDYTKMSHEELINHFELED
ncbi:hypothetical protein [Mangrovimonas cancribranchiae]|uniref:Uncharacterized protein n=1 Tax=Mangrovimonas cancribranchiae TaxID=3080055 RepID=A0AAU6P8E3_9FLAO